MLPVEEEDSAFTDVLVSTALLSDLGGLNKVKKKRRKYGDFRSRNWMCHFLITPQAMFAYLNVATVLR